MLSTKSTSSILERRMDRACSADNPKVPHVALKRTGAVTISLRPLYASMCLLETAPIGVIAFPSSWIVENLADKAQDGNSGLAV